MTAKGQKQRREEIENIVRMERQIMAKFGSKINL